MCSYIQYCCPFTLIVGSIRVYSLFPPVGMPRGQNAYQSGCIKVVQRTDLGKRPKGDHSSPRFIGAAKRSKPSASHLQAGMQVAYTGC